jgi:hypothetical protein
MSKIVILAALFVPCMNLGLVAQQSTPSYEAHGRCDDGLPRFQSWFNSTGLPSGKPYVADARRRERVIESYPKLKLQMTLAQVEQLLGEPDFSAPRASGHLSNDPRPAATMCSDQVTYMLKKTSDNLADTSDIAVYLFFSPEGKLTWAVPRHIPILQELGGPQS